MQAGSLHCVVQVSQARCAIAEYDIYWHKRSVLTHALMSAPILQMPRFDKPFIVHIDASDVAIGAVLMQKVNEMDMSIGYYSKRLNVTEARWSIYERELYAIVQELGKWRCYLVNKYTVVYSDH